MIALKPLNRIPALIFLCLATHAGFTQGKAKNTWAKIAPADFTAPIKSAAIDSSSSAVILSDEGHINFVGNKRGWFSHVYTRQTRIKILDKKAISLATVSVEYYAPREDPEKITDIRATAYNMENGQVVATNLEQKDIFEDRPDKETAEKKFSIPGVKQGSIIEYSYTITSDYQLPSWQFQWAGYPCLSSKLHVEIPQTLYYVFVRQGVHAFAVDKGSEGRGSYRVKSTNDVGGIAPIEDNMMVTVNTINHDWEMKDVPSFGYERWLTTPRNYIDEIDFQLAKTYDGQDYHEHSNNWSTATTTLLGREDFGLPLNDDNSWLDASLDKITAGAASGLDQAKAIYYYLTHTITCTDHHDPYISTRLEDVIKKSRGTVGDINLLLIAMLRRKGLAADPVMLSTRERGYNLASYPILQRLDYVIARVATGGRIYYLDASRSQLGFGQLPGSCYNGHARVISTKDPASIWFWADSLKESKTTMVMLSNTSNGLEGSWQSTLGKQESYEIRREIAEDGQEKYFKNAQTSYGDELEISNTGIDSLNRPEDPVKIHYDILMKGMAGASIIYLNPVIGEGWRDNPLKAADRKYPIEMPYTMDQTYIFTMDMPEGYVVEELPKSVKVAFNTDQGFFEYLAAASNGLIQLRCRIKLNRANFQPEDYSAMRDFFGYVVKKENEQIVLKKK